MTDFVGLSRRSPHRFTLCVSGCGSLPAHIRILALLRTASCSYLLSLLMFLLTGEQAPREPRTLRLDLLKLKCIVYKLRIAPCFALSQSYRHERFRRVSHGFTLIPVAFEIAYSLLRALRVRRACLRFRRAYTRIYITCV